MSLLEQLACNAILENRFKDAAALLWRCARAWISAAGKENLNPEQIKRAIKAFETLQLRAELYYAYSYIHADATEPFCAAPPEQILECGLFLLNQLGCHQSSASTKKLTKVDEEDTAAAVGGVNLTWVPANISRVKILIALARQSNNVKAFKFGRNVCERLQQLRLTPTQQLQVDLHSLHLRATPFNDNTEVVPVCSLCYTTNPLSNPSNGGDACSAANCKHPFIRCFSSFDKLTLVEFCPEPDIPHGQAQQLLESDPGSAAGPKNRDIMNDLGNAQVLSLDDGGYGDEEKDIASSTFYFFSRRKVLKFM